MPSEILELYYLLIGSFKYKRIAVALACLLSFGGWLWVYIMPDIYVSKARVHIDSESVLRPLMKNMAVQYDIYSMIRVMQQLMFTRPNLEKIATIAELDKGTNEGDYLVLIDQLKKNIAIKPSMNRDIFDITYSSKSPDLAKKVVQSVLTVFSEQTQKTTLTDASSAQRFIEEQLQEYETRLRNAEKAKEEFQRANGDLLVKGADQIGGLQSLKDELQKAQTELRQVVSRRDVLSKQIQDVSNSNEDWRDTDNIKQISPGYARIESLKDKRTESLLKYTETHPSIRYLDKLIDMLEKEELDKTSKTVSATEKSALSPQKMANPYVQNLKNSLDNADAEVASHQTLISTIQTRIDRVNSDWNKRLTVETEMKNLNRDYATINKRYSELLESREQASLTGILDTQTSSLKFKIADPPDKPLTPSSPNRKILYSSIFVGSIVVSFGLAFLIYFLRPVVMVSTQLRKLTGLPILGEISVISAEGGGAKKIDWIFWISALVFITGYSFMMLMEILK